VVLFSPTSKVHAEEWPVLANRLVSRTLRLFPHARLREELLNLTYEVGPSGVRVTDKGRIHNDHAVCLRGVVAGLAGPVLAPWSFFSEGRALGSTLVNTVKDLASTVAQSIGAGLTATDQALDQAQQKFTKPAEPIRTIRQIENLDEGVRSPAEQQKLDEFYETRKRNHIDSPLEAHVKRHGVYFPERDTMPTADNEAMERIRQEFNRWL